MTSEERSSKAVHGALLIAIAAALWATTSIAAKTLFDGTDLQPITLACMRLTIAFPVFFGLMLHERRTASRKVVDTETPRLTRRSLLALVALGVIMAAYQGTYMWAVALTGASIATLVTLCLAPILVAIAAAPLLGERPTGITIAALFAAIIGTILLVSTDLQSADAARIGGVLISVFAAAMYASFTLVSRSTASEISIFTTSFACFFIGALILLPIALADGGVAQLASLAVHDWLLVFYIGLVPSCVGYLCFFKGMQHTPATTSSIIVTLEPLFVALLAWLILNEQIGTTGVIGAAILTVAVLVASQQQPSTRK